MIWLSLFLYCAGLFLYLTFEKQENKSLDFASYLLAVVWPIFVSVCAILVAYDKIKKKN